MLVQSSYHSSLNRCLCSRGLRSLEFLCYVALIPAPIASTFKPKVLHSEGSDAFKIHKAVFLQPFVSRIANVFVFVLDLTVLAAGTP